MSHRIQNVRVDPVGAAPRGRPGLTISLAVAGQAQAPAPTGI